MPDKPTFVVNDRRKFTAEGELRHEATATDPASSAPEPSKGPQLVGGADTFVQPASAPAAVEPELADLPESQAVGDLYPDPNARSVAEPPFDTDEPEAFPDDATAAPGPTAEQSSEATRAYDATVDRLDTAMRAANPGADRQPPMSFERLVQSLYTQALILLGGAAQPGETPRVDILGARDTIDMLAVLADKSKGNLSASEDKLLQSALFDLRMGFLEITQALARQAAQRQPAPGGMPGAGSGPRIVR